MNMQVVKGFNQWMTAFGLTQMTAFVSALAVYIVAWAFNDGLLALGGFIFSIIVFHVAFYAAFTTFNDFVEEGAIKAFIYGAVAFFLITLVVVALVSFVVYKAPYGAFDSQLITTGIVLVDFTVVAALAAYKSPASKKVMAF